MSAPLDPRQVSLLWAGPDRAADIAALHRQLFDAPWDEPAMLRLLEHPASTGFIALAGASREVAGFVLSQIAADEAEILSIGVAPALQRSGLGVLLMQGLVRSLQKAEIKRLFLEVAADNAAAQALYAKLDFKEIGRRKAYYQRLGGASADAVNLAVEL